LEENKLMTATSTASSFPTDIVSLETPVRPLQYTQITPFYPLLQLPAHPTLFPTFSPSSDINMAITILNSLSQLDQATQDQTKVSLIDFHAFVQDFPPSVRRNRNADLLPSPFPPSPNSQNLVRAVQGHRSCLPATGAEVRWEGAGPSLYFLFLPLSY
jgi:hypothetical protein